MFSEVNTMGHIDVLCNEIGTRNKGSKGEQEISRCLLRLEVVHHRNHDPQDNSLSNLELFSINQAHKLYEARGTPTPIWRA